MDSRSSLCPRGKPPRPKIEKLITRSTVVSRYDKLGWRAADPVCCEQQAASWSETASVLNYLCLVMIGDRHVGIYASPDNWRTCLFFFGLFVRRSFGNGYLGRGLTEDNEILQDGRPRSPPGHLPFWLILGKGLPL